MGRCACVEPNVNYAADTYVSSTKKKTYCTFEIRRFANGGGHERVSFTGKSGCTPDKDLNSLALISDTPVLEIIQGGGLSLSLTGAVD